MEIPQTGGTFIRDPLTGALTVLVEPTMPAEPEVAVEAVTVEPVTPGEGETLIEELSPVVEPGVSATDAGATALAEVPADPPTEEPTDPAVEELRSSKRKVK